MTIYILYNDIMTIYIMKLCVLTSTLKCGTADANLAHNWQPLQQGARLPPRPA